jgi:GTP cyclohydrolase I
MIALLNAKYPFALQDDYDNAGVQLADPDALITGVLVSLDVNDAVIDEALAKGCNCVVAHHPFLFKGLKSIDYSSPKGAQLRRLVKNEINVLALHTNLDKIYFDRLGKIIGLADIELLFADNSNPAVGTGCTGTVSRINAEEFALAVKKALNLKYILISGDRKRIIERVAVVNGSGGSLAGEVFAGQNIDCFVTGDLTYHPAREFSDAGFVIIDAGHFGTERPLVEFLSKELSDCLTKEPPKPLFNIYLSESERSPFEIL